MRKRPIVKPSARVAERAALAASRDPASIRLRNRFQVRDEWSEAGRLAKLANERIDELLKYLTILSSGELIELLIDLRGERTALVHLVRDLRCLIEDDPDEQDPDGLYRRKASLLENALDVERQHMRSPSELRLRGEARPL